MADKLIGMLSLDAITAESFFGEVTQVEGDNNISVTSDSCSQYMAIIRIG